MDAYTFFNLCMIGQDCCQTFSYSVNARLLNVNREEQWTALAKKMRARGWQTNARIFKVYREIWIDESVHRAPFACLLFSRHLSRLFR